MKHLITGGVGFIGVNIVRRLLQCGHEVIVFDNLTRLGSVKNHDWLKKQSGVRVIVGDIRNRGDIRNVLKTTKIDVVIHLAAQVAVTQSVLNPLEDFEINAVGTLNLLEELRVITPEVILLNASTNKVYGRLEGMRAVLEDNRWTCPDYRDGVSEDQPLDFCSPYGCSKGCADQYVGDYSRMYGLRTVNFRQSCIYGLRQFGMEDQGWVAWFTIAAVMGQPITIYGDGKQVRDILFVDDLIDCYMRAIENIDSIAGETYNIGGGANNTLSIMELIRELESVSEREIIYSFAESRPGDQRVFISNIAKAQRDLGWSPNTNKGEGLKLLYEWVFSNKRLFQ